jgi:hypothetical protein
MAQALEKITENGEIVEVSLPDMGMIGELERAQIDMAIATAKKYPRSIHKAISNIRTLATYDEESAAAAIYALPRGGKPIRGPSIRLAEIVAQQWGNNLVEAKVIQTDRVNKIVTAEGTFHDRETNSMTRTTVQRRIVDRRGIIYSEDMIIVTGNAACSVARRNAIFHGVPTAVWRAAYADAERITAGDIKTLSTRREAAIKAFAVYGVTPEQIFAALGVAGIEEITLEHVPTLQGMYSSIKNGESTVDEIFGVRLIQKEPKSTTETLNKFASENSPQSGTQEQKTATDEAAPGNTPTQSPTPGAADDLIKAASQRGWEAHKKGVLRKALPPEYRESGHEAEATAWQESWDRYSKAVEEQDN